jgi:hypothetical protein
LFIRVKEIHVHLKCNQSTKYFLKTQGNKAHDYPTIQR